jgi:hypothetical protein
MVRKTGWQVGGWVLAGLLAGCGGGGGGGGSSGGGAPPDDPVAIDAANGQTVAGVAWRAASASFDAADQTVDLLDAVEVDGAAQRRSTLLSAVHRTLLHLLGDPRPAAVTGVEVTEDCGEGQGGSGTLSFDIDDGNGNGEIDLNETVTATFDGCDLGAEADAVLDGGLSFTATAATPDLSTVGSDTDQWSY